ncbi:glucose dehydrogenase [FAD, quinone]-like [Toxorhynchites rutilus septentrionalis]|uniref:glucose dehydrogenase [FAD, quinone]-like n=1 Tax=Toxorhynchites rutilus septentrionalis TaxID=329112 RepID=UPI0024787750|nr:glucose dehydrogenase [FAD, quinone]-like [Toxorhynchites rutilus septentrionalis]
MVRTEVDWQYTAERSDRSSLSIVNGTYWPRGKMLGGTGAMNGMQYIRGNRGDYDEWEKLGNPGWGWDEVLEYFIKSEDNKDSEIVNGYDGKYHGVGGYMSIEIYKDSNSYNEVLLKATAEAGFKQLLDVNAVDHIGYAKVQYNIEGATRYTSAKAFLCSVQDRPNLHVMKNTLAVSLHYDSGNSVHGVNMIVQNQFSLRALAKKEVIISAGSINTAQLLMLSGIGRREDLMPHKIPLRMESNVGGNLQDHVYVPLFFGFKRQISDGYGTERALVNLFEFTLLNRSQPVFLDRIDNVLGFVNTKSKNAAFPDIQYLNMFFAKGDLNALRFFNDTGYNTLVLNSLRDHLRQQDIAVVFVIGIDPKSRGRIRLTSANPYHHPSIMTGYFGETDDITIIRYGIRIQQDLFETNTFQNLGAELLKLNLPECYLLEYDSDDYWECYARHMSTTLYHPVGTAKMGPETDPEAVVDSRLKVYGIDRLRVVDASIMPTITSGNTNAPTVMIAEKGSDLIKNDYL